MSKTLITEDLFNNISYDMDQLKVDSVSRNAATFSLSNLRLTYITLLQTTTESGKGNQPTVLIIFANSDINAAIHHLLKSLENPGDKAVATVLVQESIKEDFEQRLQKQLKPFADEELAKCPQFLKSLETIKQLNAQTIQATGGPTLVYDFTHEQFGSQFSGVVTLHPFRTAKEAIALVGKESLTFTNASIWHENHAYAYELVAALKSNNFFINCYHQPLNVLEKSIAQGQSFVVMDKNYHYETMPHNGLQKSIVFPVGSIFAN